MIASVWPVVIPTTEMSRFIEHWENDILPKYSGFPGLLHLWLWCRRCVGYADVQIVSIWDAFDNVNAELLKDISENHGYIIVPGHVAARYEVLSLTDYRIKPA